MSETDLSATRISMTDFESAILLDASLKGSILIQTTFDEADMTGADRHIAKVEPETKGGIFNG